MSTPTEPSNPPTPGAGAPEAGAPPTTKASSKVSPTRNIASIVLLIVLLAVGGLEITALFRFKNAVNALNAALEDNVSDLISRPRVEELIHKTADGPDADGDFGRKVATYTWRGAIRSHTMTVQYSSGTEPGLIDFVVEGEEPEVVPD